MCVHKCLCNNAHKTGTLRAAEQNKANKIITMSPTDSLYTLISEITKQLNLLTHNTNITYLAV
jgi:hypothetical protein